MKIRINKKGWLEIERAGKFKQQLCPHGSSDEERCGDWCPLFGEPFFETISKLEDKKIVSLSLCKTIIYCDTDEFRDERNNAGEEAGSQGVDG